MANLDATVYDLATNQGQADAVDAIIQEQNNQYDTSSQLNYYNVIAYKQLTLDVSNSDPNGVYTTSFQHGLNYAPSVLSYFLITGDLTNYSNLPFVEVDASTPHTINAYIYITIDKTHVNLNIHKCGNSGEVGATAAIYVFSIPAQV